MSILVCDKRGSAIGRLVKVGMMADQGGNNRDEGSGPMK